MKTKPINKLIYRFITISFILIIGWYTVNNLKMISASIRDYIQLKTNIETFRDEVTSAYQSGSLSHKDDLINLNGLYGRLSGRRLLNEIVLLNNGMLTRRTEPLQNIEVRANNLSILNRFIEERNEKYFYIMFPYKIDMERHLLPKGFTMNIAKEAEIALERFRDAGVDTIDTMPLLSRTAEDIEENFYKTDHHWKPTAAFKTFRIIADHITELFPNELIPDYLFSIDNWTVHEIPEQFLGTQGKRVGIYFGGVDALQWMTPNFQTELSFYVADENRFAKGSYEDVFIMPEYLEKGKNLLHTPNYSVYTGGDYGLTMSRNPSAPSSLKLLIIKDSFVRPLQTFLALAYQEVDTIDPRYYKETSIQEYIDRTRPDVVISASNADTGLAFTFFKFSKSDDIYLTGDHIKLIEKTINIPAEAKNRNNYEVLFKNFENEKCYTLQLSEITLTIGNTDSASIALYDTDAKKIINQRTFDIDYCNQFGDCGWTFETPETNSKNLELRLFAGKTQNTKGIGVIYKDVMLLENITFSSK